MYYILYEALQIDSNEPVYCTMHIIHITNYIIIIYIIILLYYNNNLRLNLYIVKYSL